jgi:predicted Fe-S protein YdhL (DUF1289 family)
MSTSPFLTLAQATERNRQREWTADKPAPNVPSPCVSVCRMEPTFVHDLPLCAGCLRTVPEIAGWSKATDADKLRLWAELEQRHRDQEATA